MAKSYAVRISAVVKKSFELSHPSSLRDTKVNKKEVFSKTNQCVTLVGCENDKKPSDNRQKVAPPAGRSLNFTSNILGLRIECGLRQRGQGESVLSSERPATHLCQCPWAAVTTYFLVGP
ncbi:hypothetical protein EVAR_68819_1 [Eumeta japonica]|uniref:Uncharacterized protein n=1 Tax=Eumeta variegata TaxID=151549 RepID=A0A4C1YY27_EUMVA|nr:hypothetical protein EVAR_68819_1 [Eumeta japonica]